MMSNPLSQFIEAIASAGLTVPETIIDDGKLHRFASNGKPRDTAGWYIYYGDTLPAGGFGCWRTGVSQNWRADTGRTITPEEEAAHRERIAAIQKQREAEEVARRSEAATKARDRWEKATLAESHPYLERKGVQAHGIKEHEGNLIIPMRTGQDIHSLQTIYPDGQKRFLTGGRKQGCYYSIGKPGADNVMCIAEGFSTGASVHEATGYPVAVAFDAGNLKSVAEAMRERFPDIRLVICADDDYRTEGNPGITKATEAARTVNGIVAIPDFGGQRPDGATDFNDLHQHKGLEAVKACISDAIDLSAAYTGDQKVAEKVNGHDREVLIQRATDITMKPIDWLWNEWLPAGKLTILAGAAGTGKTTLALGIAAAVTSNIPFPDGSKAGKRGNVLVWSSEDAADDTLVPRLLASGADPKRCYFVQGVYSNGERLPFDPATDIPKLDATTRQIGGVALLIVDPIVSAVSGDMNKANEVRRSLQALVDFGERNQCAILGITHFTKGSAGKTPQDRVIGSQAFSALARMVWVAAKEEGTDRRVLARSKSNIAPDDGGFEYSLRQTVLENNIMASHVVWGAPIEGTSREILGQVEYSDDGEGGALGDAERFLHDLLSDGSLPVKQIKADADGAGYSWATIRRAKDAIGIEAKKEGMKSGWIWVLPDTTFPKMLKPENNEGDKKIEHLRGNADQKPLSGGFTSVEDAEDAQHNILSAFGKNEHLRDPENVPENPPIDDPESWLFPDKKPEGETPNAGNLPWPPKLKMVRGTV